MNPHKLRLLTASFAALSTLSLVPVSAQTSWTNTGVNGDQTSWVDVSFPGANWTNGVPSATVAAVINVLPNNVGDPGTILLDSESLMAAPPSLKPSLWGQGLPAICLS